MHARLDELLDARERWPGDDTPSEPDHWGPDGAWNWSAEFWRFVNDLSGGAIRQHIEARAERDEEGAGGTGTAGDHPDDATDAQKRERYRHDRRALFNLLNDIVGRDGIARDPLGGLIDPRLAGAAAHDLHVMNVGGAAPILLTARSTAKPVPKLARREFVRGMYWLAGREGKVKKANQSGDWLATYASILADVTGGEEADPKGGSWRNWRDANLLKGEEQRLIRAGMADEPPRYDRERLRALWLAGKDPRGAKRK